MSSVNRQGMNIPSPLKIKTIDWDKPGIQPASPSATDQKAASICHFYMRGLCSEGSNCRFGHGAFSEPRVKANDTDQKTAEICSDFLVNKCDKGRLCPKTHIKINQEFHAELRPRGQSSSSKVPSSHCH